ncbi:lysophospholipid acyltransferase family protein [Saccharicrinis aurantiacus]|uniref:lysophospholipid acyltransferase family protein n=1 Tax=Saccharicrinis aurantiacus TaxID=1849719 RepID=UPI002492CB40|nr:lysophospholipid acyltransferase family protein [Saccharicrinis aurantiacus]
MIFIRALFRFLAICAITLYYVVIGIIQYKLAYDKDQVRQSVAKKWSRACIKTLNVKVTASIKGSGKPEGLIMSNHRSYLDIFILLSIYPSSIVAKHEIGQWPGIKHAIELGDIILVKRGHLHSMVQTMRQIKERLDNGKNVILFPEGKINDSHIPGKFKNGSFHIAAKLNTPITPIALWYPDKADAWIGDELFIKHFFKQMGKKETLVKLCVMEPEKNSDPETLKENVHRKIYNSVLDFDIEQEQAKGINHQSC